MQGWSGNITDNIGKVVEQSRREDGKNRFEPVSGGPNDDCNVHFFFAKRHKVAPIVSNSQASASERLCPGRPEATLAQVGGASKSNGKSAGGLADDEDATTHSEGGTGEISSR